jgi:hypothetical protein
MTIASRILALATVALAVEGATFLRQWITQMRPGDGTAARPIISRTPDITLIGDDPRLSQ